MDYCGSMGCPTVVGDNDEGNSAKTTRRLLPCVVFAAVVAVAVVVGGAVVFVEGHNI